MRHVGVDDGDEERVRTAVCDASDEAAVEALAATLAPGEYSGLVVSCAGKAPHGPVCGPDGLATAQVAELMDIKVTVVSITLPNMSPLVAPPSPPAAITTRRPVP